MNIKEKMIRNEANVMFAIPEYFDKDENYRKLMRGEITLVDFVDMINEKSPYKIESLYGNKYQILDRKINMPIEAKVSPDEVKNLSNYFDSIAKVYPELNEFIMTAKTKVKEGCTDCSKNGISYRILSIMGILGGENRDLSPLTEAFSMSFISALEKQKRNDSIDLNMMLKWEEPRMASKNQIKSDLKPSRETITVKPIVDTVKAIEGHSGHSCLNCVRKHIATAKPYLDESLLGYKQHRWLAVGELCHAEKESLIEYPQLADKIRVERLKVMEDKAYIPNLMLFFELIDNLEGK